MENNLLENSNYTMCTTNSDGCLHCYIHKGDFKRNVNTNEIVRTKDLCKQANLANIDYKKQ